MAYISSYYSTMVRVNQQPCITAGPPAPPTVDTTESTKED